MLPDALPELIDTLLRLPRLDAAQLRELIEHLPDPPAAAQEMVRRGWITQDQFSSLFSGPEQPPMLRETMLLGFGDDEPDGESDNWDLPVGDEEAPDQLSPQFEEPAAGPMAPESEPVDAVPVQAGAAPSPFEWDILAPPVVTRTVTPRRRPGDPDKLLRQWMGWSGKGLLVWAFFVGSFCVGMHFLRASAPVRPAARQASRLAKKKPPVPANREVVRPKLPAARPAQTPRNQPTVADPPAPVPWPPAAPIAVNNANQGNAVDQNAQPVVQVGVVQVIHQPWDPGPYQQQAQILQRAWQARQQVVIAQQQIWQPQLPNGQVLPDLPVHGARQMMQPNQPAMQAHMQIGLGHHR